MTGKRIHELWVLALVASTCRTAGADSTVVFNEIMYHPASREAELEWVELHNQMAVDMDLSGWTLSGGVAYRFPEGTVVDGGGFVVVAISPTALEAASGFAGALGPLEGRLDNSGERLELRDNNHRLMDRVSYRDGGTWPVEQDGSGLSLAKRDPGAATAVAPDRPREHRPLHPGVRGCLPVEHAVPDHYRRSLGGQNPNHNNLRSGDLLGLKNTPRQIIICATPPR